MHDVVVAEGVGVEELFLAIDDGVGGDEEVVVVVVLLLLGGALRAACGRGGVRGVGGGGRRRGAGGAAESRQRHLLLLLIIIIIIVIVLRRRLGQLDNRAVPIQDDPFRLQILFDVVGVEPFAVDVQLRHDSCPFDAIESVRLRLVGKRRTNGSGLGPVVRRIAGGIDSDPGKVQTRSTMVVRWHFPKLEVFVGGRGDHLLQRGETVGPVRVAERVSAKVVETLLGGEGGREEVDCGLEGLAEKTSGEGCFAAGKGFR